MGRDCWWRESNKRTEELLNFFNFSGSSAATIRWWCHNVDLLVDQLNGLLSAVHELLKINLTSEFQLLIDSIDSYWSVCLLIISSEKPAWPRLLPQEAMVTWHTCSLFKREGVTTDDIIKEPVDTWTRCAQLWWCHMKLTFFRGSNVCWWILTFIDQTTWLDTDWDDWWRHWSSCNWLQLLSCDRSFRGAERVPSMHCFNLWTRKQTADCFTWLLQQYHVVLSWTLWYLTGVWKVDEVKVIVIVSKFWRNSTFKSKWQH